MKNIFKPVIGAGMFLALAAQPALAKDKNKDAAPAPAAAAAAPAANNLIAGLGVASLGDAMAASDAFRAAQQQRPITYKAAYDAADARGRALEAQLKPLIDKFNADRKAPKPVPALLQQQAQTIQQLQEAGKQDIQKTLMPVALSEAYVQEQIEEKLDQAVQNAMTKRGITMLVQPQAVLARANGYDITGDVLRELNTLIPTAQLVPPAGWEPREIREERAARAAQAAAAKGQPAPAAPAPAGTPAAPRPAPAGPQPDSR